MNRMIDKVLRELGDLYEFNRAIKSFSFVGTECRGDGLPRPERMAVAEESVDYQVKTES